MWTDLKWEKKRKDGWIYWQKNGVGNSDHLTVCQCFQKKEPKDILSTECYWTWRRIWLLCKTYIWNKFASKEKADISGFLNYFYVKKDAVERKTCHNKRVKGFIVRNEWSRARCMWWQEKGWRDESWGRCWRSPGSSWTPGWPRLRRTIFRPRDMKEAILIGWLFTGSSWTPGWPHLRRTTFRPRDMKGLIWLAGCLQAPAEPLGGRACAKQRLDHVTWKGCFDWLAVKGSS